MGLVCLRTNTSLFIFSPLSSMLPQMYSLQLRKSIVLYAAENKTYLVDNCQVDLCPCNICPGNNCHTSGSFCIYISAVIYPMFKGNSVFQIPRMRRRLFPPYQKLYGHQLLKLVHSIFHDRCPSQSQNSCLLALPTFSYSPQLELLRILSWRAMSSRRSKQ